MWNTSKYMVEIAMQTEFCELCGAPLSKKAKLVQIAGAKPMRVCEKCAKLGTEVQDPRARTSTGTRYVVPPASPRSSSTQAVRQQQRKRDMFDYIEGDVVEDYAKRIAQARQEKGYTQNDLAFILKMQEVDIRKFERGERAPTEEERKKLEKELGISLLDIENAEEKAQAGGVAATTLGDVIQLKRK
ncbi:MAG TPA: multiprotein bridging factor aMBF1 [Methanocorpusculum sp.]|nr:multiprotein bridging factor aMBF1 [Methanocorpusculum sp.]HJJ95648.1 multiprotein bridging factor aMBF1 [Methanocorpusculum sp.]